MQRFLLFRIVQGVITLLLVTLVIFVLSRLTGDPLDLMLPLQATPADFERVRSALGLDQPIYVQYVKYLGSILSGDFGESIRTGAAVGPLIFDRLINSLTLAATAIVVSAPIGVFLGVKTAVRHGSFFDLAIRLFSFAGMAAPSFLVGLVLMLIFSRYLGLLPSSGMGSPLHYVLPAMTISFFLVAGVLRFTRSSMLDALDGDYITLARAKGVPERTVIWKHALRNALIPVITYLAFMFGTIVAAAIVVEVVFSWPGLGRLTYQAVVSRDFPVLQGAVLVWSIVIIVMNLLADVVYSYLDPRIRY